MSSGTRNSPVILNPNIYRRIIELGNEIMRKDKQYHGRLAFLKEKGTTEYHIDNDVVLSQLSGATRVLCDMATGLSAAYMVYREVTGHTEAGE